jgi:predicted enzyme related to lactoylglutathione lyase
MALIQDPTGAVVGVWQPSAHPGAEAIHAPGAMAWNELQTRDLPAAESFYGRVFGWTGQEHRNGYLRMELDGQPAAGIVTIGEDRSETPPNWNVYFWVDDVYATAGRARELGGTVVHGPQSMGEYGDVAVIRDPQGAHFTIARWNEM